MSLLTNLWEDLKKVLGFAIVWAPVVAIADPNAAIGIAKAQAAVTALMPVVAAVAAQTTAPQTHEQMVDAVTAVVQASSQLLTNSGVVTSTTNEHLQALVPLIHIAVLASGAASTPPASPLPAVVL